MDLSKTSYTIFLSMNNFKHMEKDEDYLILASKSCAYVDDEYMIAEFKILSEEPEDHDPEVILNSLGGLALHEDGSNAFLVLESDIDELDRYFSWEGSADILMSELLTANDKILLLKKKQKTNKGEGPIWINVKSSKEPIWRPIENAAKEIFEDASYQYKFGSIEHASVDIWWPFIFQEECGFYMAVKQNNIPDKKEESMFPLVRQPNPFKQEDDEYFIDPEDYNYMRNYRGA